MATHPSPSDKPPLTTTPSPEGDSPDEARHEQLTLYAVGAIALLFFCFVVLPLMIQFLGTPRPDR